MRPAAVESCAIAVFAKLPEPGQVKTRLIPRLGADGAARLHTSLLRHAVRIALASGVGPVRLWCAPSVSHPLFPALASQAGLGLETQSDGDLGQRMLGALSAMLGRAGSAIVVGADCPARTAADFAEARDALACGYDAVLGPVEDGGYHLLAVRRAAPLLFDGIGWGSDRVLEQTRERLSSLGWRWHELRERWDVDRPEDLDRLLADPALASLASAAAIP